MSDLSIKAIRKLNDELNKLSDHSKCFAEPCINYLKKRCKEEDGICEDILLPHKTWAKCYKYIYNQAEKLLHRRNGQVCDDTVFEWAEDYFRKDDKDIGEQKTKEDVKRKEKQSKAVTKANIKPRAAKPSPPKKEKGIDKPTAKPSTKPSTKPDEKAPRKKRTKDIEGQMDIFSIMGMEE